MSEGPTVGPDRLAGVSAPHPTPDPRRPDEARAALGPALVVAIDGPSGSGKSSVSRAVATRLGTGYLDTGAMYRALAWWCRERGIDLTDADAVAEAARGLPLVMGLDPSAPELLLDGRDIGQEVRRSEISTVVSAVATNLQVRRELIARQRRYVEEASRGSGVVAEGRDITTVVAPDAPVRVLLSASEEARLRRRSLQLHGEAGATSIEQTRDEVVRRDRDDATVAQFQTAADGVSLLDTSDLTFDESVDAVLALVRGATHPARHE